MKEKADPTHLRPREIRYLALEGGGGKGYAYLGAIEVLEKQGVMRHVDGVAGTSAGAITALMLSLGMTVSEIQHELDTYDFDAFFDPPWSGPHQRLVPQPSAYESRTSDPWEEQVSTVLRDANAFIAWQLRPFAKVAAIAASITGMTKPISVLTAGFSEYFVYFYRDMGFFSGHAAREYFDDLLRRAVAKKRGVRAAKRMGTVSFGEHKEVFRRDLLVCGSNLSTGKTVLFSWKHTRDFPVADAVRISMGFPIAYKPYVIQSKLPNGPACGTYVDGGVWNNLPFREISSLSNPAQRRSAAANGAVRSTHSTLGLRLEIDPPRRIVTGADIMWAVLVSRGGSESQVLEEFEPQILLLDTEGLELFEFAPNQATRDRVGKRSRRAAYRYFGLPIPEDDRDDADDARVEELKRRNACD